ncbi:MAG TPA: hypothetical protein VME40_06825 [Caulobacteraceae bacterium]|nr:hypothetical protein [Caulobacteraceae bacterium]
MVYAFEFLKYVDGRAEPVVGETTTRFFSNDQAARAHALRVLPRVAVGGVFGCRVVREDNVFVTLIISGASGD